jgi:hypothetical protein
MNRDKIQQIASDAGGVKVVEYADPQCFIGNMSFTDQELAVFAGLVLEEAALKFDQPHKEYFGDDIQLTIRALKPED